jgi:erythromycin esterase-like protein
MSSGLRRIGMVLLVFLPVAFGLVGASLAYFISVLITGQLLVNLLAALIAFLAACYLILNIFADSLAPRHPRLFAGAISLMAAIILSGVFAYPQLSRSLRRSSESASPAVISALQSDAIRLESVQAGSGFADLEPLKKILEGKRIVALGEATHGTREFFQMKHRMLEFLVREMGYQNFGMEISAESAQVINRYITTGEGDPAKALAWPWSTREVLDMIEWMRAYNADPGAPFQLTFYGIDPIIGDRDRIMAENVAHILEGAGPQSKIVIWAHNEHISNTRGWLGNYLKRRYGDEVYLAGFEFDHGSFTSRMAEIHTYTVGPTTSDYYAYTLSKVGEPLMFLDFRSLDRAPVLSAWLAEARLSHNIAELYALLRLNPAWVTESTNWADLYDGLIFIEVSTPAQSLQ